MIDLRPVIRQCRMDVCLAYVRAPALALEEISSASLRLTAFVHDGALSHHAAYDPLQEVAENLGLVRRFGQNEVQDRIAYGPQVYAALQEAA